MGSAWRLPGYRVERLLGAGAFGEVWRATVRATGAPVALKRIRLTDRAQRDAALAEAAVLGALDHPNLIRLHRLERVEDALVLVLDLAAGGSLAALLGARGRLTPGETISALAPVAGALSSAHLAGVVHGDVTPANILFSELGLPLLADLGVSRLTGDRKPVHTTLPYADPVVAQGFPPDPSSDVYMLGAVALHTLTGHPPPSAAGELDPGAWSARVAARLATAEVPPPMAAVVGRAMSLEPGARRTATDFALDLTASGRPVAVELAAGRARVEPSLARLAALAGSRPIVPGTGSGAATPPGASAHGSGRSARPAGPAAVPAGPFPGRPPITQGARLPSPMPPARHRRASVRRFRGALSGIRRPALRPALRPLRRPPGRRPGGPALVASGLVLALVLALVVVARAGVLGRSAAPAAPQRRVGEPAGPLGPARRVDRATTPTTAAGTAPSTTAVTAPTATPATATAPPPATATTSTAAAALAALDAADAARAEAFATRDPGRLSRVYAAPELVARDRATMTALVPPGCSLRGVRTQFGPPQTVAARTSELRVRIGARLQPSRLWCGGRVAGSAPGTARTVLDIRLIRTAAGWRIAGEHPVGRR